MGDRAQAATRHRREAPRGPAALALLQTASRYRCPTRSCDGAWLTGSLDVGPTRSPSSRGARASGNPRSSPRPFGRTPWHPRASRCGTHPAPGDVDSDTLASGLLGSIGAHRPLHDPVGQITETLAAYSPLDVCIVLDDAHEIRWGWTGAALVDQLVRCLPCNAHVVLATRHTLPTPLSRLWATDRVLEVGQHDLLFTAEETAAMAARLGRGRGDWRPRGVARPVRLALAVRPNVAIDFVQEEVLSQLDRDQLRALFVLAHFGYADTDRVQHMVGRAVDLDNLALTVPLVSRTDDNRFRAHELWAAALQRLLDSDDIAELRAGLVRQLLADGDPAHAGRRWRSLTATSTRSAEWHTEVVRHNTVALPLDMVRPWVEALE